MESQSRDERFDCRRESLSPTQMEDRGAVQQGNSSAKHTRFFFFLRIIWKLSDSWFHCRDSGWGASSWRRCAGGLVLPSLAGLVGVQKGEISHRLGRALLVVQSCRHGPGEREETSPAFLCPQGVHHLTVGPERARELVEVERMGKKERRQVPVIIVTASISWAQKNVFGVFSTVLASGKCSNNVILFIR